MANAMTRRGFLTAGGASAAGLAALGVMGANAYADEAPADAPAETASGADYDVLIIGAGLAGLAAGIRLLEDGVENVLIVTKGSAAGTQTNSSVAGGTFNFPKDDSEEAIQILIDVYNDKSEGKGREDLTELICRNARGCVEWLESHGCEFTEYTQSAPYDVQQTNAAPGSGLGMSNLMNHLGEEFESMGGEVWADTKMIEFVLDDKGAVGGAKVRDSEGIKTVTANSTIVATGGYVANKELMEVYVGPDGDQIMVRGFSEITGDGINAAVKVGAMMYQAGGMEQTVHLAAVSPANPAMCNPYNAIPQTIAVNIEGERYVDESQGYVTNGKAVFNQPDQTCALIFDSAIYEMDAVQADIEKFQTYGAPILTADTIEELAEQINVDPDVLAATVADFNEHTDGEKTTGLAVEKTACANKIEVAPFYAFYPLNVGSIMCFGGLYTDGDCRVLEPDGTPIGNFYAAGEIIGGVFQYDYLSGSSLDRSVTTGVHVADLIAGVA